MKRQKSREKAMELLFSMELSKNSYEETIEMFIEDYEMDLNTIDLEYIKNITFYGDVKLIFQTILKVFKRADISEEGMETAEDFGDYLLRTGKITKEEYDTKQLEAKALLGE